MMIVELARHDVIELVPSLAVAGAVPAGGLPLHRLAAQWLPF